MTLDCPKCGTKSETAPDATLAMNRSELLYCNRGTVTPHKVGPHICRLVPEHLHVRCPRCHYEPDSVWPLVTDHRKPAVFQASPDPLAGAKTGGR